MPELPEMENYKLLLNQRLVGHLITDVQVEREKSINVPVSQFRNEVIGTSIQRVERRAKHLLFHLSNARILLLHLMLGGIMFYGSKEDKPDRTVQVTMSFHDMNLYFIGLRLGYLHLYSPDEADRFLQKLGPEPTDRSFTAERFASLLHKQSRTLKATLPDQAVMAGIGNCYSDEICFEAGLLPSRKCDRLSVEESARLYDSMQHVLTEATRYGGYMDMPLYAGDELTGGYDSRCKVYDREGEPCVRCGHPIERRDVSSKKSFCCTHCQH
ncbi:Fpg/Nei family DNA glycosylase [Paenibacillus sp. NPDC056579]|uniref:Fpg/Nei family DNA glycosylase n=1 Tax=Paenibacillus sp. NPDC056579 TaxID=3345871 RepID=UPI0036A5D054